MSKLIHRAFPAAFVLGVLGAIAFGAQAALAAERAPDCLCDPADEGANAFCVRCCGTTGSICPLGGTGERECLCV